MPAIFSVSGNEIGAILRGERIFQRRFRQVVAKLSESIAPRLFFSVRKNNIAKFGASGNVVRLLRKPPQLFCQKINFAGILLADNQNFNPRSLDLVHQDLFLDVFRASAVAMRR